MKTVKQYLQEIPDQVIRDQALANLDSEKAGEWSISLPAALRRAFLFTRSPEGYKYWNDIWCDLAKHESIENSLKSLRTFNTAVKKHL